MNGQQSYLIWPEQQGGQNQQMSNRDRVANALMRQPTDMGSGLAAVGQAIADRKRRIGQYPAAPGGGSLMAGLQNMFGANRPSGGGLY